jgi:hypothetical protein
MSKFKTLLKSINRYPKVIEVTRYGDCGDNEILGFLIDSEEKKKDILKKYDLYMNDGYKDFDLFVTENHADSYQSMLHEQSYEPIEEDETDFIVRDLNTVTPDGSQYREHFRFEEDMSKVSDGYHTFEELYEQRLYLTATLFNQNKHISWKSKQHDDGSMFEGNVFVVGIETENGQFTYHYKIKHWDLFDIPEIDKAPKWDGHTAKDVKRLLTLNN